MKSITIMAALLFTGMVNAQNTFGEILGTFMSDDGKIGAMNAHVFTTRGEEKFMCPVELEDGTFRLSAVPAGDYTLYGVSDGDTVCAGLVEVFPESMVRKDFKQSKVNTMDVVVVIASIKLDYGVTPTFKLTNKEIVRSANKFNTKDMIASMSSEVRKTDDGELVFRGARKGDVVTFLDGIKMSEIQNVPSASLGYIMVYSGAIPAKYGDTLGGVVVMETMSYFDLYKQHHAMDYPD